MGYEEKEKENECRPEVQERVDWSRFWKLINRVDGERDIVRRVLFRVIEAGEWAEVETWISRPWNFWIWNRNLTWPWIFMSANGSEETSKGFDRERGNDVLVFKNKSSYLMFIWVRDDGMKSSSSLLVISLNIIFAFSKDCISII